MTRLFVGAVLERLPSRRYCEQFAYCEFAPRAPLPRPSTLRRWWYARHHETRVGLVAPRSSLLDDAGKLQLASIPEARFQWLCEAAKAVGASYVRVTTGREVTPGARDRERLAELCSALAERSETAVVWAPGGLWEPEAAAAQAERMGVGLSVDVLEQAVTPATQVYGRAAAVGTQVRLGRGHLEAALQSLLTAGGDEALLAIEADNAVQKARTAAEIALELAEDDDTLELAAPATRERD